MIECRHCRGSFDTPAETIGARCPDCKMPLFERPERSRREVESGECAFHPITPGICNCARCGVRLCGQCRTRWHEESVCLTCVEDSLAAGEKHPREIKSQRTMAVRGFVLAMLGGLLFLVGFGLLYHSRYDPVSGETAWGIALMLVGVVPAAIAVGQAAVIVLIRGPMFRLASAAVAIASSQIGLTLGLAIVNFWRNV